VRVTVGIPTYNRPDWLRQSIESVLAQTMTEFRLVVSDNASDSATQEVVEAFADERIEFVRAPVNTGMTNNMNRVLELAKTEFVVVLPDDDLLYPEYLASSLAMFDRSPGLGVVHTAFDLIDDDGRILEHARHLVGADHGAGVERGHALIERGMRSSGLVCWTSALFRTDVITAAERLRLEDEPFADQPLLMRIGVEWDVGWIARPLVAVRMHADAASAMFGLSDGNYNLDDSMPSTLLSQRLRFLDEGRLPSEQTRCYRALALRTYRRDTVGLLSRSVGVQRGRLPTLRRLAGLARSDLRVLLVPGMVKLLAALVIGRPVQLSPLGR
jgi:glycosyltransferase involved in cell wall biosynthesis